MLIKKRKIFETEKTFFKRIKEKDEIVRVKKIKFRTYFCLSKTLEKYYLPYSDFLKNIFIREKSKKI